MLRNYFKIAWRSLWKNKVFSLVNIFGLSIALTFTILISAFVWGELNINHHLKNADRQYILLSKWKDPNMGYDIINIAALPQTLKALYPNLVENYYRWDGVSSIVSNGDKHFREGLQVGDSTFLTMFGFELQQGDPSTALADPFSAVVTEAIAQKYFGKTDVVGQKLNIENFTGSKHDFVISGVLKDIPENSVTRINDNNKAGIFLSSKAALFLGRNMDGWNNTGLACYVTLRKGVSADDLTGPIEYLIKRNAPAQISENLRVQLAPLKTYYLDANNGLARKLLYTLSGTALFIILMAIINFVNICIGRSAARMKEMGLRKVFGGRRKQLIYQSLVESMVLVLLSTVIALATYSLARPVFNAILGKEITPLFSFPLGFYLLPLLFSLFVGFLAGIYPALVLSSLKSVDALKGRLASVKESILLRKLLVGFQFGTAALVFIMAFIVAQQVRFFFKGDLGYNKDYIIYAQVPRDWSKKGVAKMEAARYGLSQLPMVKNATLSWEVPDGGSGGSVALYRPGVDPQNAIVMDGLSSDNHYGATYGIGLKAGSFFSPQSGDADSTKIVINEKACKALGWKTPQAATGQLVNMVGSNVPLVIAGVTADFHLGSLKSQIQPVSFINVNRTMLYRYLSLKLVPGDMQQHLAVLQKKWNAIMPGAPFEYQFMDEGIARLYAAEIRLGKASKLATALTVIIVLLGVLGLVSLSIQKRTKEVGIRKVLGASVKNIIGLFIREFLSLVLMAAVIASPVAYLIMHHWLSDYAYHIKISPYPFIAALLLLTLLATLLITLQTLKTAFDNPTKSLKTE